MDVKRSLGLSILFMRTRNPCECSPFLKGLVSNSNISGSRTRKEHLLRSRKASNVHLSSNRLRQEVLFYFKILLKVVWQILWVNNAYSFRFAIYWLYFLQKCFRSSSIILSRMYGISWLWENYWAWLNLQFGGIFRTCCPNFLFPLKYIACAYIFSEM